MRGVDDLPIKKAFTRYFIPFRIKEMPVGTKASYQVDQDVWVPFKDNEIERAIATRSSGCKSVFLSPLCWVGIDAFKRKERLDRRELNTDLARIRVFYFRRGYRAAEVDTAIIQDRMFVDLTFRIDEGEPVVVRDLEVAGLEEVASGEEIISDLQLKPLTVVIFTERLLSELDSRNCLLEWTIIFSSKSSGIPSMPTSSLKIPTS